MTSRLAYTSVSGDPRHAAAVARIHAATQRAREPQYLSLSCDGPCCTRAHEGPAPELPAHAVPVGEYEWDDDYSWMRELTCRNHPTAVYLTKNPYMRGLHLIRIPDGDIERGRLGECTCPFSDLVVTTPNK